MQTTLLPNTPEIGSFDIHRKDDILDPAPMGCVLYFPCLLGGTRTLHGRSLNRIPGTIVGATWRRHSSGQWYLYYDDINDYVQFDNYVSKFASLRVGTIWGWIKPTVTNPIQIIFSSSDKSDPSSDLSVLLDINKLWLSVREAGVQRLYFRTNDNISTDSFTFFAIPVGPRSNAIYLNDSKANVTYNTGNATTRGFFSDVNDLDTARLGIREDNGGLEYPYGGIIAQFGILSVTLNPFLIHHLYQSTKWRYR